MGFKETVSNFLNPYTNYYIGFVYGFIFFVLLCLIAYYVYKNNVLKELNKPGTSDIPNSGELKGDTAVHFFFADWCPHCTKAKQPWNSFKTMYTDKTVNGYKIKFKEHDMTDDDSDETNRTRKMYNIEGYPTVKMKKGNDMIDFDAKITIDSLKEFIENVTQD